MENSIFLNKFDMMKGYRKASSNLKFSRTATKSKVFFLKKKIISDSLETKVCINLTKILRNK